MARDSRISNLLCKAYQKWEILNIPWNLKFTHCAHGMLSCRCSARASLKQVAGKIKEGHKLLSKKELKELIITEYTIPKWEEDTFFIIKMLKDYKLC